ncbi:unnamed protein product [Onchocerca flexuosa]|uniref:Uncharacterized protein n=1 Tax=Onchocerca flexuosa TaxID=387005 RepID=A0A3P7XA86_9BILA|nr:unnamed protein product [Onchocerca flexuosa]
MQPVLKKHRVDVIIASGSKTPLEIEDLPSVRRSPRKHPSSSLVLPTTPKKFISPSKPAARRSLTNVLASDIFQDMERPSANFVIPESELPANTGQCKFICCY